MSFANTLIPLTFCKLFALLTLLSGIHERIVFPGQRLLLEALKEAQLEIHTGTMRYPDNQKLIVAITSITR